MKLSFSKPLSIAVLSFGVLALVICAIGVALDLDRTAIWRRQRTVSSFDTARKTLLTLCKAIDRFKEDCGRYPTETEGLASLERAQGIHGWRGPYLAHLSPDPWQVSYGYEVTGHVALVRSAGPDRVIGTSDDFERRIGAPALNDE